MMRPPTPEESAKIDKTLASTTGVQKLRQQGGDYTGIFPVSPLVQVVTAGLRHKEASRAGGRAGGRGRKKTAGESRADFLLRIRGEATRLRTGGWSSGKIERTMAKHNRVTDRTVRNWLRK